MAPFSKYPARVVNVGDEEDAHPGSVSVEDQALVFSCSSMTLRLTYEEVILDFSGKRNAAVHFQHPDHPQWRVTAYEHRILRERVFKEKTQLRQQVTDVRRRQQGVGKVVASIFFVAFLVGMAYVAGYAVEQSVPKVVKLLPTSRDGEVAERVRPLVEERYPPGNYGPLQTQLNEVLARIVPAETREEFRFKATVVEDPRPVAFSAPGGEIYISIGLLRVAQEPEQVAAVLAHEAGHVILRHAVRQSVSRKGASMILRGLMGDQEGITRAISQDARRLVAPEYPRLFEIEADNRAWSLLTKAEINPAGLSSMLTLLFDRVTSEIEEERPLASLIPEKERWDAIDRLTQTVDKEAKFSPVQPFAIPAAPVAPPTLDL
jgi:Zn-dependent protease with chaperone function